MMPALVGGRVLVALELHAAAVSSSTAASMSGTGKFSTVKVAGMWSGLA